MSVDAVAQPATSETTTARAGLVLALIVTCQLMIVLDATVVNVALPPIQQDLRFSATGLSWVVSAYTLAFGGLLLFGGRLGDVFGRRRVFGAGVTLFTLASLVGGSRSQRHRAYRRSRGAGRRPAIAAPTALGILLATFAEGALPRRRRAERLLLSRGEDRGGQEKCASRAPVAPETSGLLETSMDSRGLNAAV